MIPALHVHLVHAIRYRHGVLEADHVHLLIGYPPKVAVSALVNTLNGVSARKLPAEFTGRVNCASMCEHFWSPSCLAASCGGAPRSAIRQCIEQQHPA